MPKTKTAAATASLDVYWGSFLYNACMPLCLDLNWCSHACAYCFANLNTPDRKANVKQAMNLLSNFHSRDTYAAHLLREGYPIVFSNHVDPFAASNDAIALPLIDLMAQSGISFSLQTKGGKRLIEALDFLEQPIVFYVSIATLDEDIARKVEPGAPPIADRLKMIEKIVDRGHMINVGINPTVPQWLPNPSLLTDELAKRGVWGAWVQPMHLSRRQIDRIPARGKAALGQEVIDRALHRRKFEDVHETYIATREAAAASGLQVYNNQQHERSDYFAPYRQCYSKTFPLMQDFVNHCHDTKQDGDAIYWEEFRDYFTSRLPSGVWGLRGHLNASVLPQVLYGKYIPQQMDYEQLLLCCWEFPETLFCPVNTLCFSWAGSWELLEDNTEGWVEWHDDNELPILIFEPNGGDPKCLYRQWKP